MIITIDTSDEMRIKFKKEEIKKIYFAYGKFIMNDFMMQLLKIVGDMYRHIMDYEQGDIDELEQGDSE
jgi:hypothetical protein